MYNVPFQVRHYCVGEYKANWYHTSVSCPLRKSVRCTWEIASVLSPSIVSLILVFKWQRKESCKAKRGVLWESMKKSGPWSYSHNKRHNIAVKQPITTLRHSIFWLLNSRVLSIEISKNNPKQRDNRKSSSAEESNTVPLKLWQHNQQALSLSLCGEVTTGYTNSAGGSLRLIN
jgi:hypothetical protein